MEIKTSRHNQGRGSVLCAKKTATTATMSRGISRYLRDIALLIYIYTSHFNSNHTFSFCVRSYRDRKGIVCISQLTLNSEWEGEESLMHTNEKYIVETWEINKPFNLIKKNKRIKVLSLKTVPMREKREGDVESRGWLHQSCYRPLHYRWPCSFNPPVPSHSQPPSCVWCVPRYQDQT